MSDCSAVVYAIRDAKDAICARLDALVEQGNTSPIPSDAEDVCRRLLPTLDRDALARLKSATEYRMGAATPSYEVGTNGPSQHKPAATPSEPTAPCDGAPEPTAEELLADALELLLHSEKLDDDHPQLIEARERARAALLRARGGEEVPHD